MKVVVLSVCDAIDVQLIRALEAAGVSTATVRIVSRPRPGGQRTSLLAKLTIEKLRARVGGAFRDWQSERMRRQVSRLLFGADEPPAVQAVHEIASTEINTPAAVAMLADLAPDLLFVSGAPILKPSVLATARIAAVNVHYGMAPDYRGEHTLFWPLYLGDYERIGVTLHHLDGRIDGGHLLAIGRPALDPSDGEAALYAKCARLASSIAVEIVGAATRGVVDGEMQHGKGRLFLKRQRRLRDDLRYGFARFALRRRPPIAAPKIMRYFPGE